MISFIAREDICSELGIDDYTLCHYEQFLELPEPQNGAYDVNIAKLIARLHELVAGGLALSDIRQLSFCADQFSDLVPGLKTFRDFSPQHHLKELVSYYNEMIAELSSRESHYQDRIHELETVLQTMQIELEKNGIALDQIENYQLEKERYVNEIDNRDREIEELRIKNNQNEVELHELKYQSEKKDDELEKVKAELEFYLSQDPATSKRSAVDIKALLKKKEKEIALKYQREIFDLKKQVDLMMERKEEEWFNKRTNPSLKV